MESGASRRRERRASARPSAGHQTVAEWLITKRVPYSLYVFSRAPRAASFVWIAWMALSTGMRERSRSLMC